MSNGVHSNVATDAADYRAQLTEVQGLALLSPFRLCDLQFLYQEPIGAESVCLNPFASIRILRTHPQVEQNS